MARVNGLQGIVAERLEDAVRCVTDALPLDAEPIILSAAHHGSVDDVVEPFEIARLQGQRDQAWRTLATAETMLIDGGDVTAMAFVFADGYGHEDVDEYNEVVRAMNAADAAEGA
jgi:hypothetical protein